MEHFLQHPWFYFKEYDCMQLISGLLSVALTVIAMQHIDNQAKERWTQEGYLRRKIELEIEIRKVLLNIKKEISRLSENEEIKSFLENNILEDKDLELIDGIFKSIRKKIYNKVQINEQLTENRGLKIEYNIEPLLNEYVCFDKNIQKPVNEFINSYTNIIQLIKETTFYYVDGNYFNVGNFSVGNTTEIKKILYNFTIFQNNLSKILEIINNIPQQ